MFDAGVEIVVVGSHAPGLLVEVNRFPRPGETVMGNRLTAPLDGGKGSNQALAAAALGGRVAFVGRVGTDGPGDDLVALLRVEGVDYAHVSRSETASTGAGINIVDADGTPEMIVIAGANDELTAEHVDAAFATFVRPRVVLTQMEIDPSVAVHAARAGKALGAVSIVNAAPATAWPLSLEDSADVVDILVVNETEAATLDGGPVDPPEEQALPARLRALTGAASVIVTLGGRGLHALHGHQVWRLDGVPVPVTDTSGAGDVFCAALAVAIAEGRDIDEACSWASSAAASSVMRAGTIAAFPTRVMVDGVPAPHRRDDVPH